MNATKSLLRLLFPILAAAPVGCGPAPEAEDKPTWRRDILPIVQANCASCHGPTYKALGRMSRYDFVARNAEVCADAAPAGFTVPTAESYPAALVFGMIDPKSPTLEGKDVALRMPPAPANWLTDAQIETFRNWLGKDEMPPFSYGSTSNKTPTAKRIGGINKSDDKTTVTIQVSDADGDQVIGKATVGTAEAQPILGVGGNEIDVTGLDGEQVIELVLCDGSATVTRRITVDLK